MGVILHQTPVATLNVLRSKTSTATSEFRLTYNDPTPCPLARAGLIGGGPEDVIPLPPAGHTVVCHGSARLAGDVRNAMACTLMSKNPRGLGSDHVSEQANSAC